MHIGWPAGEKAKFPTSFRSPKSASIPASCFRPSETKLHKKSQISGIHMNNIVINLIKIQ